MKKTKNFTEEYIQINGIEQYFLHYPSPHKEVIIHLHGGPGSAMSNLAYTYSPILDYCNIVFYDQRGAGRTQKRNKSKAEDLSIDVLVNDLRQTISYVKEKYETDSIILLGQSWGTVLGTQYVLKHPKDVIGFIGSGLCIDTRRDIRIIYDKLMQLIESSGNKNDARKLAAMQHLSTMKVDEKDYVATDMKFTSLKSKYGLNMKVGGFLKTMFKSPVFKLSDILLMVMSVKANFELTKSLIDYSIWETTEYSAPIFYVLGKDDWQTTSVLAAEYFEKINAPQKSLYWIEKAGHVTNLDNPADFFTAINDIVMQLR